MQLKPYNRNSISAHASMFNNSMFNNPMPNNSPIKPPQAVKSMLFALLILTATLPAKSAESWGFETLMQQLAMVKHAKLDFTETKKSIFLTIDTITEGEMEYRAPDFIEKITHLPFSEKIIINGDHMTVEKLSNIGKSENLITQNYFINSHPLLQAAVAGMRAMLAGDFALIDENYAVEISGTRDNWALSLAPRNPQTRKYIDRINLTGSDIRIAEVITIQADGDESILKLSYNLLQ